MVPPNNLGPDLSGKAINETQYRGMIGSLMYLTTRRRDIQFSTCLCARYQANPNESYLIAVKRIFSCNMDMKSILGACQLLGGKLVRWSAKKQQSLAMSSVEAEYVDAAGCCANIIWMKSQLTDYDIIYEKVPIFCDNTSAIAISNNPVLHSRTKHIDIRYYFIRDHILKGDIELHFIPTQYQLADIFTKPLYEPTFKRLIIELGGIRGDIGYSGEIRAKGPLKKGFLPPGWRLLMGQIIQCLGGKTGGLDQISNKDATILYCLANGVRVDYVKLMWEDIIHKLNNKTREKVVPYHRFISLLLEYMMPEYDNEELTINLTQSSSAKDKSPSHPSPLTLVVGEMHKEAHQAAGGPTSLGATSKEGAHPQLSSGCDASADSIAEADPEISAPNDSIPLQQGTNKESRADEISNKIKLEDLLDLLKDTRSAFFTPDSPQDEPIIILDESEEEEEVAKDKDTYASSQGVPEDTSIPYPPSPKLAQIQELMAQELLIEVQALPVLVSSVQKQLNTLDSLPSLLNKVTDTLNRFASVVENVSGAMTKDVPSAGQATTSPAEGEKNTTKDAETNLQNKLVDLLGIDVVEQYHNKKLLIDKYYDKTLKIGKSSKILNCDVLTQKGPISLKVYREDGTIEVIVNFKVSDLHQLVLIEKKKDGKPFMD
ncbi:hypothetical protein Tco_0237059 [Tanacetum coccineum]